jgi:putative ABC transport system permease protein
MAVSEGYFAAMGIPVLEGRGYLASDADGTRPVTIVNARVAREYFAGRSALGGRMQMSSTIDPIYREIVGIVADVHHDGLDTEPARQMFLPLSQFPTGRADAQIGSVSLVVRTNGDPSALIGPVRARLAELDPEVPVALVSPMDDLVTRSTSTSRLYLILFTLFSGLALVIVSVGVYGVASYLVATRRRELAIRRALGATAGSIVRLVLGEGAALAAVGVGAGVVGALAFGSLLESLLFGVTTRDLLTFVAVPVSVAIVTVLANLLPARTALRENAVHALRLE